MFPGHILHCPAHSWLCDYTGYNNLIDKFNARKNHLRLLAEINNNPNLFGWEDDPVQSAGPDFTGGINSSSLNEARIAFNKK